MRRYRGPSYLQNLVQNQMGFKTVKLDDQITTPDSMLLCLIKNELFHFHFIIINVVITRNAAIVQSICDIPH